MIAWIGLLPSIQKMFMHVVVAVDDGVVVIVVCKATCVIRLLP